MVAADAAPCAPVGVSILEAGGTAVDAAVATLFCNGVVHSESMGIGIILNLNQLKSKQA